MHFYLLMTPKKSSDGDEKNSRTKTTYNTPKSEQVDDIFRFQHSEDQHKSMYLICLMQDGNIGQNQTPEVD